MYCVEFFLPVATHGYEPSTKKSSVPLIMEPNRNRTSSVPVLLVPVLGKFGAVLGSRFILPSPKPGHRWWIGALRWLIRHSPAARTGFAKGIAFVVHSC